MNKRCTQRIAGATRKRLNNASKEHRALLLHYGNTVIELGQLIAEWRDLSYKARPESDYRHEPHLYGILRTQSVVFAKCADQLHALLLRNAPASTKRRPRSQRSAARP